MLYLQITGILALFRLNNNILYVFQPLRSDRVKSLFMLKTIHVKNDLKLQVPLFIDFMLLLIMELYLSLVEGEKALVQTKTKQRLFFCL